MAKDKIEIDSPNSTVSFSVKKLGLLTVKGQISDLDGEIEFDKEDLDSSSFNVSIGASTIDTGNQKRDEHLKSKDFFFVKEHPKISFISTSIVEKEGKYQVKGNLTMLETTKEVSIPFTFINKVFSGEFSLNRKDYKLGAKFPALIVAKTIQISINCKIK